MEQRVDIYKRNALELHYKMQIVCQSSLESDDFMYHKQFTKRHKMQSHGIIYCGAERDAFPGH